MGHTAKEKIIVALDVPNAAEAEVVLDELSRSAVWCKIGMQLFTSEGPRIVRLAQQKGFKVFLDLKFHDIPNTVASGVSSAVDLGVEMLTIHLMGGPEMIAAAAKAAGEQILVLGVTVLTSSTAQTLAAVGVAGEPQDAVLRLAALGEQNGLRGIVCSPLEISPIRSKFGSRLKLVTPGVRPAGSPQDDQKRVLTPEEALQAGADWLVIGRPILASPDRRAAFEQLLA